MKRILVILMLIALPALLVSGSAQAFDHTHTAWENLLKKHVVMTEGGVASKVIYSDFKRDEIKLKRYLNSLSAVPENEFRSWNRDQRLAFLINAYNAFTIELILDNWPVKSIKETGSAFKSPWKKKFIKLFDKKVSLDGIEHGMIRKKGEYDEPRIHFAVVCASIGCPALQNRAFTAENLETLLESGTTLFLSDKSRNRYNKTKNTYELSKIFKWYGGDFSEKHGSLNTFLKKYATFLVSDGSELASMGDKEIPVRYLEYDWSLNTL